MDYFMVQESAILANKHSQWWLIDVNWGIVFGLYYGFAGCLNKL